MKPDDGPVVHFVREPDGTVLSFIPLADYEALSDAAVELCERVSALPQASWPTGGVSVLALVRGTKVCT